MCARLLYVLLLWEDLLVLEVLVFSTLFSSYSTATKSEKDLDLYYAASKGDLDKVKKLVQSGMSASVAGPDERTPLHAAASGGHTEVCF